MGIEVILPRVDMDMTTGRISRWYVAEGETVEKGQPLFEIETDKAAMEIEAPGSGILQNVVAAADAAIPVGSVVAWISAPGESVRPRAAKAGDGCRHPCAAPAFPCLQRWSRCRPPSQGQTVPFRRPPWRAGSPASTPSRWHDLAGSGPRGRVQASDVRAGLRPAATQLAAEPPTVVKPAIVKPAIGKPAEPRCRGAGVQPASRLAASAARVGRWCWCTASVAS